VGGRHRDPDQDADDEPPVRLQRVAAYAVVVVDDRVLLTELSDDTPSPGSWTLPGGGIDHGEAPLDAVVREVYEETAHDLRDVRLLDVGSHRFTGRAPATGRLEDFQGIHVIYTAGVEQVREPQVLDVGGSTSSARWVPFDELASLRLGTTARRWLGLVLDRPDLLPATDRPPLTTDR
jgi:8-oxo-dGTP diphosphatase